MNTQQEIVPPSGELQMPDPKGFKQFDPNKFQERGAGIGRVEGIDYDKWAVATIDMAGDPSRIASTRARLAGKGYQRVQGQPVVNGFTKAEVWVLPRDLHGQRLAARANRIQAKVDDGSMTEFALSRGHTERAKS